MGPNDDAAGFPSPTRNYDVDDNINWTLTTRNVKTMKEKLVPEYWERLQFGIGEVSIIEISFSVS